jgi:hypothetical protein
MLGNPAAEEAALDASQSGYFVLRHSTRVTYGFLNVNSFWSREG